MALARVMRTLYCNPPPVWGVHPSARLGRHVRWSGRLFVGPQAIIGDRVHMGADCQVACGAVIESGATLGHACYVGPGAVIAGAAVLGSRVRIAPGARVGGPGFAFSTEGGTHHRVPHLASCHIGDDVEIGANATIDAGKLDPTTVGQGTKIDNLVHIGHSARIGHNCLVMAQVGIAGSVVVEDDVILAGQAGLADHLHIGQGARIAAQSGVIGDIPAGTAVSGFPARPHREVMRQAAALARLTPLARRLEGLASTHATGR